MGLEETCGDHLVQSPLLEAGSARAGCSGLCPAVCIYCLLGEKREGRQGQEAELDTELPAVLPSVLKRGTLAFLDLPEALLLVQDKILFLFAARLHCCILLKKPLNLAAHHRIKTFQIMESNHYLTTV